MQTAGLLPDITVRETVQLTASLFSHRIDAEEAMRRAGVTDFASRIVKKCSGGQQQRLRFAMALVSDPALLILDEPTTGMDVEGAAASGRPSTPMPSAGAPSSSPRTTLRRPTPSPTGSS